MMKLCSVKETAERWRVSERLVRRLCIEERIPEAVQENGNWLIPSGLSKPQRKRTTKREDPKPNLSALAKRIVYQRGKNNHFGIYEYIQVNLTYSSNRMASNRLTRNQVEEVYRTGKITTTFEATKVDDIIETINHFAAIRYVIDHITTPLSQTFIKNLHHTLTYGTYADRKDRLRPGEFRLSVATIGVIPGEITTALSALLKDYEKTPVTLDRILDFHVRFEQIHPFEDYNGRIGRLIMMKECLRHDITPFIIDDKHRSTYNRGIATGHTTPTLLTDTAAHAQTRFQRKMELCKLSQYARHPEPSREDEP